MNPRRTRASRQAYTLIEMLLVIAIMGVMIAIIVPLSGSSVNDELASAAHVVASDVNFTRDLAVSNGSEYTLTFSQSGNSYRLQHTGDNTLLHVLPDAPFGVNSDLPIHRTCNLAQLPGAGIELLGVEASGSFLPETAVIFGPLGALNSGAASNIWLAAGNGASRRYMPVHINPVLGSATTGQITAEPPFALISYLHSEGDDGHGSPDMHSIYP